MTDNIALLIFGLAIVYTVYRAVILDRRLPWFSAHIEQDYHQLMAQEEEERSKKKGT